MQHCTNCGAIAREGAKFCTSCGVRLEPGVTVDEAPLGEGQESATAETAGREGIQEPEVGTHEGGSEVPRGEETTYQASWPDSEAAPQPAEAEQDGSDAAPSDTGLAGWPDPETSETAEAAPTEPEAGTEDSLAGWGSADSEVATEPGTEGDLPGAETGVAEPEEPQRELGASEWEGWSPTPSPESAVHHHEDDSALRDIRELVDALQRRLDRLADPVSVSARGVDADELADQLNGWASEGPDSDELLWVIRDARDNPRDIDAVARLADRAEELERLVERYGAISSDARRWVARLRQFDGQTDD